MQVLRKMSGLLIIVQSDGGKQQYDPATRTHVAVTAAGKKDVQSPVPAPVIAGSALVAQAFDARTLVTAGAFDAAGARVVSEKTVVSSGTRIVKYDDGRIFNERQGALRVVSFPSGRVLQSDVQRGSLTEAFGEGKPTVELRKDGASSTPREAESTRARTAAAHPRSLSRFLLCSGLSLLRSFARSLSPSLARDHVGARVVISGGSSRERTTYLPTGVTLVVQADGTKLQTSADGTVIKSFAGGRRVQKNRDGTIIETLTDGTQRVFRTDGSGTITKATGVQERFGAGKFRASLDGLLEMS